MPSAGFETAIPAFKLFRTHAVDRKATWSGMKYIAGFNIMAEKPYE